MNVEEQLMNSPAAAQWKRIGVRHHHGINLPLFSLRSRRSCGIGEFPDLYLLLDFCHEIQVDVIQLLPLNDTGRQTSPYSALSAIALNPLFLGLAHLSNATDHPELRRLISEMQTLSQEPQIPYEKLHPLREDFLRKYFLLEGENILRSSSYQTFVKNNSWVEGYALFKTITIQRHWESWEHWPEALRDPTSEQLADLLHENKEEVQFHTLIQHLCFQQMISVKKAANERGIFLKGDIPILINRQSADVWLNRPLFRLDLAAGAPPDMYSKEGQNWNFPLYNWDEMEKIGYQWWKQRLQVASTLYDIYRLDHIVGFFRIWAIPLNKSAVEGSFIPTDESIWIAQGTKIMQMMLDDCPMLPIGEDLGAVPQDIRNSLTKMGICGTKVMRWERQWATDQSFIDPKKYNPESMTTVSTHDSETLSQWWRTLPAESKIYAKSKGWDYSPELLPDQILEILQDSHSSGSFFHINLLQEYFPLVKGLSWPDPEADRINIPSLISDRNWSYRFRPSVEEIIGNRELKLAMCKAIHGKKTCTENIVKQKETVIV
jgi:4-alpha-glucanotransferase